MQRYAIDRAWEVPASPASWGRPSPASVEHGMGVRNISVSNFHGGCVSTYYVANVCRLQH